MIVVEAATGVGAGVQLTSHKLKLKFVFQVNEDSQVGEARADARSKDVVAGKIVHPVLVSLLLYRTDIVETTLYSVRVYHQSREASRTFNVCPLHLLGAFAVEFPYGLCIDSDDPEAPVGLCIGLEEETWPVGTYPGPEEAGSTPGVGET